MRRLDSGAAAPTTAEGADLVVETVAGHTEFREGGAEGFGFAVTNCGTVNATNVVITVDLGGLSRLDRDLAELGPGRQRAQLVTEPR